MKTPRQYDDPDIGSVILNQRRHLKHVRITVKPDLQVQVSFPYRVSATQAIRYVQEKKGWIVKTLRKFREEQDERFLFTPAMEYHTHFHKILIKTHGEEQLTFHIGEDATTIRVPDNRDPRDPFIQDWIRHAVEETWRVEAKRYLPSRVASLAAQHHFQFRKVAIRNAKTRWGSCSDTNNINLSLHLMRLPYDLIDFVILHELCHTIHKHHGWEFHALLDRLCNGEEKRMNARLRRVNMKDYRMVTD
ncbi:MAG: hypothetical protein CSA95_00860 [Bacteroidetes bacterium]|nr:MAG: hypothetical protein CSA95_00860 [Bacteroidota bacterium]PIE88145.1 MAG: hypothetical protein CSA04_03360 [Bacteroidota bacterium]